jgi:cation-transporting ATPase 13A1
MESWFRTQLTAAMIIDFAACFAVQQITKALFSNTNPKEIIARGQPRREKRRLQQATLQTAEAIKQNGLKPDEKASSVEMPKYLPKA